MTATVSARRTEGELWLSNRHDRYDIELINSGYRIRDRE